MKFSKRYVSSSLLSLGSIALLTACAAADSETLPSEATVSLPGATDPVGGPGASSISALLASAGVKLVDAEDSSLWGSGKNRPFCEMSSLIRDTYREASSADRVGCYVNGTIKAGMTSGNLYDGNYHYLKVTSSGSPMLKVKMKGTKSGNLVTSFEMLTCNHNGSTYVQGEYVNKALTSTSLTILSKYVYSEGGFTGSSSTQASGTIDPATGYWTGKTIVGQGRWSDGANTGDRNFTLTQGASNITASGANKFVSGGDTHAMEMVAKMDLLNAARLSTIAVGHGSAKAAVSYNGSPNGGCSPNCTSHWDGDSRATAGTSDYAADVASASLPTTIASSQAVSFTAGETWDCDTSDAQTYQNVEVSQMTAILDSCDTSYGFGSNEGGGWACQNADGF